MYRFAWFALFLLAGLTGPTATAQLDCPICGFEIETKVHWGRHVFCSEDCRHEFYIDRFRCKICNRRVDPASRNPVHHDGIPTLASVSPPKWDGYCDGCREGVRDGHIDAEKDRFKLEEDTRPSPAPVPNPPPRSPDANDASGGAFGLGVGIEVMISVGLGLLFWLGGQLRGSR